MTSKTTTSPTSGRGSLLTCGDIERNPGPRDVVRTAASTRPRRNGQPAPARDDAPIAAQEGRGPAQHRDSGGSDADDEEDAQDGRDPAQAREDDDDDAEAEHHAEELL
eukprot:PhM_4_TR8451/c3_g1_i4/m.1392